jgi:glycine cleavage system H protein
VDWLLVEGCEFPDDVYVDVRNDVWIKPASEHQFVLGITSILSFTAGRVKALNPKKDLVLVKAGQGIATMESVKYFGAIRTPIDARVLEFNPVLSEKPRVVNDSPYADGWIAKLEAHENIVSLATNSESLLLSSEAVAILEERIKELKVHCFKKLPDEELVSVGVECSATLANLDELLRTRPKGTVVHVVSDDPFAEIEMIRWSDQTGNLLIETRNEENLSHFIVEKNHS